MGSLDSNYNQFDEIIDDLQTAFGKMLHHVESHNELILYWKEVCQSENVALQNLPDYEEILKDLSSIRDAVNIYNTAAGSLVKFTSLASSKKEISRVSSPLETKAISTKTAASAIPAKDCQKILFNYDKIRLAEGDSGKCIISSIVDNVQGLTYITVSSDENAALFFKLQENCLSNGTYQWIPPSNTIFGYRKQDDDQFYRAICVNNSRKFSGNIIDIFLVDFGLYTTMDTTDPFYILSGDFKNLPGQARLAKILKIDRKAFNESNEDINNQLRWNFQVVGVTEHMMYIDLMTEIGSDDEGSDMINSFIEPPSDFASDADDSQSSNSKAVGAVGYRQTFEKLEPLAIVPPPHSYSSDKSSYKVDEIHEKIIGIDDDLDDEDEEEEFEGTSNALKAVLGYVPRDDRDYCKFFDPKTLGCFKGPHCRKIHLPLDKEGWTQDTEFAKITIPSAPLPQVGSEINGFVTCVVNPEICYIQMEMNCLVKLFLMNEQIDYLVSKNKLAPLTKSPKKFDLVTANYYGHWHRAQIVDFPIGQKYRVRYVDYGNTAEINRKDLRKWCSEFDHLPFFAYRVRIANVSMIKEKIVEATKYLHATLMETNVNNLKNITFKIIEVDPEIRVTITYPDGFDVGENMVGLELVEYRKI